MEFYRLWSAIVATKYSRVKNVWNILNITFISMMLSNPLCSGKQGFKKFFDKLFMKKKREILGDVFIIDTKT